MYNNKCSFSILKRDNEFKNNNKELGFKENIKIVDNNETAKYY